MVIRKAKKADLLSLSRMTRKMWPDAKTSEIFVPKHHFYVAEQAGKLIAFIMLNARQDYVPGSSRSPVGYIEGIFVEKNWRKKNVGRLLVKAAEEWCREKGLNELGSDVKPGNKISQKFHSRVGFTREELVVPYIKKVRST